MKLDQGLNDLNWYIKKLIDSHFNLKQLGTYPDETAERKAIANMIRKSVERFSVEQPQSPQQSAPPQSARKS